jgi:hypothetical protein
MKCLICGEPAPGVDMEGGDKDRACPKCGQYRISDAALVLMKTYGWHFDVELTRTWFAQHQGSGTIPTIDRNEAALLIDV